MGLIFLAIDKLWLDLYGNYVVYYTMKIINLRTGKVKTKKPKVLPKCEICDTEVEDDVMSDNLTDALNHVFKREGVTNFTIEASTGEVFMLTDEKEPEVIRKYSIYGEN